MEKRSGKASRKAKQTTYVDTLLIDYDHTNPILKWGFTRQVEDTLMNMLELLPIVSISSRFVDSKHGYHIYIGVEHHDKWTPGDVYALQAVLGDDKLRTMFNIKRNTMGWPLSQSNVFFEENEV